MLRHLARLQLRQQGQQCPEDDVQVGQHGAVVDVDKVQPQLAGQDDLEVLVDHVAGLQHRLLVAVEDGRRAGDAGAHRQQDVARLGRPVADEVAVFRARPDDAHLPLEHVPQLGQFVDLGVAQPVAEGGNARVTLAGDARAVIAGARLVHGAELENVEGAALSANALAPVEDGPG
jgi:hypothetical protein